MLHSSFYTIQSFLHNLSNTCQFYPEANVAGFNLGIFKSGALIDEND